MSEISIQPGTGRVPRGSGPRWRRVTGWTFVALAAVLTVALVAGFVLYNVLNGDIARIPLPPGAPKHEVVGAQNWLIMGSDSRACPGCARYGHGLVNGGARSDTTILAHLSRGASSADLVSIPRDSYVQIPACREPGGGMSTPQMNKFNAAFSIGGPQCTVKTVESLTHIPIDHFVVVDFEGFKQIVNSLGGVTVCLRQPIHDPVRYDPATGGYIGSGLEISAGTHTLNGNQALAFVRSRYAVGNGSDLTRIKDQQAFISAMIRQVFSAGLLAQPWKLYDVAHSVVNSLTVDSGLSLKGLVDFATQLHGLPPSKVRLLTVPIANPAAVATIGGYQASVVTWNQPAADALWRALRQDKPLPGSGGHHHHRSPSPSSSLGVVNAAQDRCAVG